MPVYRFRCDVCGLIFEKNFHMNDDKTHVVCPNGHTQIHRLFSKPFVQFKGKGFYINDSRAMDRIGDRMKEKEFSGSKS
jgi:putative FmdB family regulatory protein